MHEIKELNNYIIEDKLDLERIVKEFTPYARTIINNAVNDTLSYEDKEEIITDTFFILWKNQDKVIVLDSYIAGITRNLVKEKLKKRKITYDIADYENIAEYSKIDLFFEERDEIYAIKRSLNNLKKIDLKIVKMFYYQELTTKEISIELGISETNVRQRLFKIRRKIKKELK